MKPLVTVDEDTFNKGGGVEDFEAENPVLFPSQSPQLQIHCRYILFILFKKVLSLICSQGTPVNCSNNQRRFVLSGNDKTFS